MALNNEVYLIDASIFVFRSYFAKDHDYYANNGEPINAVYGFARFLTKFIHQTKAQNIACCFDESLESSFRNEIYPAYKANREPAPDDLKRQFKLCQEVSKVLGVATYADGYYEADDLIGTLATYHQQKDKNITIISADKDLAQLLTENDKWWSYGKQEPLNSEGIYQKFGVMPNQIVDFLALTGDSVDNISGVPGIGEKTASILLNHFKTLDEIIKRHQEIRYLSFRGAKSCQKKIAKHIDDAILARKLTTIKTDIPLADYSVTRNNLDEKRLQALFEFLQFGPLLRRQILDINRI